ncbi:MAG: tryptophan--tRNA ligase [archaeon]
MKILITKKLLNKYPEFNCRAIIVDSVDNNQRIARLDAEKKKIESEIVANNKNPSEIKLVKDYNEFFNKFSKSVPIQFQLESILKGKEIPKTNPLVEVLFMLEMKHAVMISGHDTSSIKGDLIFDLSDGSESFVKIDGKSQKFKADDILLKDEKEVITTLLYGPDFKTKMTEKTTRCVFLFWFFKRIDEMIIENTIENLREYMGLIGISDKSMQMNNHIIEGEMEGKRTVDPYSSELIEDYNRMIREFGLEHFDASKFPEPNRIMRRGIVYAGRDLKVISDCIKQKKPFYVLSGIMPTSPQIHFGTKMVVENIAYFQKHGAIAYILVADLEALAARGVSLEEGKKRALDFHIPAYVALGLDPKKTFFYFQSENMAVVHLAYEFAKKITLNEFRAIYGNADPGRIMSAVTQVGDILFPQIHKGKMPGIIPTGTDQDPHIRLTRDIVDRTKLIYNFSNVCSIYHKYMPSLDGSLKMSKSNPDSCISLPEDPKVACKKIKKALTGGRDTLDEHRRLGAVVEKDMVFELMKQHLIEDDEELNHIYKEYKSGKMTSGELKEIACKKITDFMINLEKDIERIRKDVGKLNFIR